MMYMKLFLVRHAASTRARLGIWGSLFDAPLEDGFEDQLAETKSALASIQDPKVFSSPLSRCRETTAYIYPHADVRIVEEFRAYHSGIFEGKTEAFVREQCPHYMDLSYRERFLRPRFEEESVDAQAGRVGKGLVKVLREGSQTSMVVAHYSTINIIAHISSLNWNKGTYADGVYDLKEGAFINVTIDPVAVMTGLQYGTGEKK
ncbi:histidine phosphatase family protein [Actinomadura sp. 7K534]|uniref:histidine phosphatase family protein n=1 Tax=Actinomadura sp. 7K534 TaxID=2530366 RepID=UPI001050AC80|nr:histidine phosphatase family protein [Actinomadura sp. 7K534]TDB93196.1 histidine phosphatase family protein [Actinomadura sp. 7K534]